MKYIRIPGNKKKLGVCKRTIEPSFTNRIQELKQRISGVEDKLEEMDILVKGNINIKKYLV